MCLGEEMAKTGNFPMYLDCFVSIFEIVSAMRGEGDVNEKIRETQQKLEQVKKQCKILKIEPKMNEILNAWRACCVRKVRVDLMANLINAFSFPRNIIKIFEGHDIIRIMRDTPAFRKQKRLQKRIAAEKMKNMK